MGDYELIGTRSWLGRNGHVVIFLAGFYVLPPGRARSMYLLSWGLAIGGLFMTDFDHPAADDGVYLFTGYPTVWTWLLWAASVFCYIELWRAVGAYKRAMRAQYAAQATAQAAPPPAPVPPAPTPLAPPAPQPEPVDQTAPTPAEQPAPGSKLILPSHTERRVRRGGETLSGIPIKDRRAVDPRSL